MDFCLLLTECINEGKLLLYILCAFIVLSCKNHLGEFMKKIIFGCLLASVFCATPVMANPTQTAVAKKAIYAGEVMPYATPEFKQLLRKAYDVQDEVGEWTGDDFACEFSEHFYLGHGNGGLDGVKNWKATANNNVIRVTFSNAYHQPEDVSLVEFIMKGSQIHDVRYGYSSNPKKAPTKTTHSLREEAQKMVKTGDCAW